jgi:hypothetical protein
MTERPELDELDQPLWGAARIAEFINRKRRQTYYLLSSGLLDANKIGETWVSTPRRLRRSLGMEAE